MQEGKADINYEHLEEFIMALFNLYDKYGILAEFGLRKYPYYSNELPFLGITLKKGDRNIRKYVSFMDLSELQGSGRYIEYIIDDMRKELLNEI